MKNHILIFVLILLVISLSTIMTACNPSGRNSDIIVGNWEAFIAQPTGYGTDDKRIGLEMDSNGACLQSTSSTVSGMVYEELNCTYEIKDDGRTWITFENGRTLQVGLKNNQLVIYNMFPSFGTEPNIIFDQMK
ncbi:MAG: hypothetical protein IH585_00570 [Anaerolineaceae bacterium]|nr:hypothetical protein [Anaerolineaceae bacterium]